MTTSIHFLSTFWYCCYCLNLFTYCRLIPLSIEALHFSAVWLFFAGQSRPFSKLQSYLCSSWRVFFAEAQILLSIVEAFYENCLFFVCLFSEHWLAGQEAILQLEGNKYQKCFYSSTICFFTISRARQFHFCSICCFVEKKAMFVEIFHRNHCRKLGYLYYVAWISHWCNQTITALYILHWKGFNQIRSERHPVL